MDLDITPNPDVPRPLGRVARRKLKTREALIAAGREVMGDKGIDSATMNEIAEAADVGAGTIYSYFQSKDDLAIAVLESLMRDLARAIEAVTDTFDDPAQVYAYGCWACIRTATTDARWRHLLDRTEVVADAMFVQMGPYAKRDLERATAVGRFRVHDAEATFRIATHAIVGGARAIARGELSEDAEVEIVAMMLQMAGVDIASAREIASRPKPSLS